MIERGRRESPTVLVVDDEPDILESLADVLRKEFHVLGTSDPEEALALLASEEIAVVLSDQRMPKLSGAQLLAKASNLSPDTIRVLLTGYADIEVVIQAVNDAKVFYYLSKPWKNDSILDLVRTAVQTHNLSVEERRLIRELGRLQGEGALASLRSDPSRDARDVLSRDVANLRAGLSAAQVSSLRRGQAGERIPVCSSCARVRTGDSTWTGLVAYLRESSLDLVDVLCPDCAPRGTKGSPEPGMGA